MVTDPVGDFLIRLKNASMVGRETTLVPSSKMNTELANLLLREKYISGFEKRPKRHSLEVSLVYKDGAPAIQDAKRISKPSRRMYMGLHEIHPVKRGQGILVLSTPKGLMTGIEAKKAGVGGEVLFELW